MEDAIRVKKAAWKSWLQNKTDSSHSRYAEAQQPAALTAETSKVPSWENFDIKLDFNRCQANKVFWQAIRCRRDERSNIAGSNKDQHGVFTQQ